MGNTFNEFILNVVINNFFWKESSNKDVKVLLEKNQLQLPL